MSKLIKITLILFLTQITVNQLYSQSYSYKFVDNNPKNAKNFSISAYTGFDFGTLQFPIGIQANYMISRFSFEGRFAKGIEQYIAGDSLKSRNIIPFSTFEASAAIHLSDRIKGGTYKYVLSVSQGYSTTTTTYLPIPIYSRRIFAIRGGIHRYTTHADIYYKDNITGAQSNNYYNIATSSIFGGFLFKKVRDFKVGVEGFYRKKGIRQMRDFYLDFMYCPKSTITNGRVYHDDKSEIKTRNFGFRMGIQWRSARTIGGNFKMEFGLLPGYIIPDSDLYTLLTYGINISSRIGKKYELIYDHVKK